ncbi:hypothetical protein CQ018_03395 [Arthrobacter sp. MYb227]|uniref:hypothetical protein n=1 Tax=Arthrobacter sp. MYb227 TaxID=1848601 RepID=UPI000CFD823A|nr:hypothetical protein [Arthrobacter sp. MYb227]PQZ96323.1 hypothetical protein CQ018_03395 [Arthrobacter sp. MYb227]
MINDESASQLRFIIFCLRAAKITLIIGAILFLIAGVFGFSSPDIRKSMMSIATYILILPMAFGMGALKLSSSIDEDSYRDTPLDTSWRWKPWSMAGIGFVLVLASAGFSV